ncbi:MAG TPA: HD domain-containing protein [Candidatus Dormibacteraeota bacterium]|nr:HD domain-containing protein [Candidatus Dormibacteraeota bacterium]
MPDYDTTRISCPVHATIRLGALETAILNSGCMQRLRNIKQLSLASYVFPGGDYSRLSHGLGVLHVASSMLTALHDRRPDVVDDGVIDDLRVAALVHDIGHLPFSHTMEQALRAVYEESAVPILPAGGVAGVESEGTLSHEEIGAGILRSDPELSRLLSSERSERIGRIIQGDSLEVLDYREAQAHLGSLLCSDLDADRIDYLMRTARHTGLPYGGVDLPILLSQIRLDDADMVCFGDNALHAVDQCLISRYFDRVTIPFHRTVAGFELLLQDVIRDLIAHGLIAADRTAIEGMIEDGSWVDFDDLLLVERMRALRDRRRLDRQVRARVEAILHRRPPRLLAQIEYVEPAGDPSAFEAQLDAAEGVIAELAEEHPEERLYLWKQDGFTLTSLASGEAEHGTPPDFDESEERPRDVRMLVGNRGGSTSIRNVGASLMTALADKSYYAVRIYSLTPPSEAPSRALIEQRLTDPRWQFLL